MFDFLLIINKMFSLLKAKCAVALNTSKFYGQVHLFLVCVYLLLLFRSLKQFLLFVFKLVSF